MSSQTPAVAERRRSGSSARTVVPAPGGLWSQRRPPRASIRSVSPAEPGSTVGVGAAATVVAHPDPQHRIAGVGVVGVELDVDGGGVGVFGGVGQGFGRQVVGGGLDGFGQPVGDGEVKLHRHRVQVRRSPDARLVDRDPVAGSASSRRPAP